MLAFIAVTFTIFVYGLVAAIVKLDDLGLALHKQSSRVARALGAGILRAAPYLIKGLTLAGTAAMFLVGGGIVTHGIPFLHRLSEALARQAGTFSSHLALLLPTAFDAAVGIVLGGLLVFVWSLVSRLFARQVQTSL